MPYLCVRSGIIGAELREIGLDCRSDGRGRTFDQPAELAGVVLHIAPCRGIVTVREQLRELGFYSDLVRGSAAALVSIRAFAPIPLSWVKAWEDPWRSNLQAGAGLPARSCSMVICFGANWIV